MSGAAGAHIAAPDGPAGPDAFGAQVGAWRADAMRSLADWLFTRRF